VYSGTLFTVYRCKSWRTCVPCLIDNGSIALSRGRFVLARRASVAERISRELDGAAQLRGGTRRHDWPGILRRAAHVPANIWFGSLRGGVDCLICAAGAYAVAIRLEGRVLSAKIEYVRSRYFVQWREVQVLREPSMLAGDRVLSVPVSRRRFGISKSRIHSAEIEHSRSQYIENGELESRGRSTETEYSRSWDL